jgi:hypothetical protein
MVVLLGLGLLVGAYLSFDVFVEHMTWSQALGDLGCMTIIIVVGGILLSWLKKSDTSSD